MRAMYDTNRKGTFGRPPKDTVAALPEDVQRVLDQMHRDLSFDWTMSGDWIVVRCWETPDAYSLVAARVHHQGKLVSVP